MEVIQISTDEKISLGREECTLLHKAHGNDPLPLEGISLEERVPQIRKEREAYQAFKIAQEKAKEEKRLARKLAKEKAA